MTRSRAERARRTEILAGPLGKVKVYRNLHENWGYKIACRDCTRDGDNHWSTHANNSPNDFVGALDRWSLHLEKAHPDSDAPCLAYLNDAKERQARRS